MFGEINGTSKRKMGKKMNLEIRKAIGFFVFMRKWNLNEILANLWQ
jgi:hypothetical protein